MHDAGSTHGYHPRVYQDYFRLFEVIRVTRVTRAIPDGCLSDTERVLITLVTLRVRERGRERERPERLHSAHTRLHL